MKKFISFIASFAVLFNSFLAPLSVMAEDLPTPEPTPIETSAPAPTATPEETIAPETFTENSILPETGITPSIEPSPSSGESAKINPELITPSPTPETENQNAQEKAGDWTFEKVELNKEYTASGVTLVFTKLPENTGNIKINVITLSEEQIKETGSLTDKAYDITSDMQDGTFAYNLILPVPNSSQGKSVDVKYTEDISKLSSAQKAGDTVSSENSVSVSNLDHFTVFIVVLEPSWTAPGAGGVFSAYIGPTKYSYVSPGNTAIYDGREAGIIKAGISIDADGHYWDEGLFGFMPDMTINTFAGGPINYDVTNQEGTNPVWMTIEIDTGIVGDRTDNTTFQFVPTSNPIGWHTVDAGTGLWQRWADNKGTTTGSLFTLGQIASTYDGLNVVRAYLRLGMGDSYHGSGSGTIAWVDKVTLRSTVYDFVVLSAPSLISPINNAFVNGASLTNSWSSVPAAVKYVYESYNDEEMNSLRWRQEVFAPQTSKTATDVANAVFWWRVRAIDEAGNMSEWSPLWKVTVDNTPPTTPTISGFLDPSLSCGAITNSKYVTVDWTDSTDNNAVKGYDYEIDYPTGSGRGIWDPFFTTSFYAGSLNEGIHYIKVRAKDMAENTSDWSNVCSITYDSIPPFVQITSPTGTLFNTDVIVRGTVTDANPHHYWLHITKNGSDFLDRTVNMSSSFTDQEFYTLTEDGNYVITLAARDAAGGTSSSGNRSGDVTKTFTIDKTAPAAPTITDPDPEQAFNVSPILNKWDSVSDTSGINKYQVWYSYDDEHSFSGSTCGVTTIDSKEGRCRDVNYPSTQRNHSPSSSEQGGVTIRVRAVDNAGNLGEWSDPVHYYFDATNPEGGWVSPLSGDTVSGNVALNFNATGSISGIKSVSYQYAASGSADFINITGGTWDTTSLPLGNYILRATATDNAGNPVTEDITVGVSAIISNQIVSTPYAGEITITWHTNYPTTSQVVYDTVPHSVADPNLPNYGYEFATGENTNKVYNHSVSIAGLVHGQVYYFRTISHGSPVAISSESSVKTLTLWVPPAYTDNSGGTVLGVTTALPAQNQKLALANEETGNNNLEGVGENVNIENGAPDAANANGTPAPKVLGAETGPQNNTWKIILIALAVLLAGYGFYKYNKNKKAQKQSQI